jgi:hypothetical protein
MSADVASGIRHLHSINAVRFAGPNLRSNRKKGGDDHRKRQEEDNTPTRE